MPLDVRHPTAPHKKLKLPEWYVSDLMLDRALDAILRRVKLDRRHDIPISPATARTARPLHRPAYAAIFQTPGAHGRHRPLSHSSRGGGKDADRSARAALPSRPSDRHTRRAGGRARGRRQLERLRSVHEEVRQAHRRRAADQAAKGSRYEAVPRRARRRFAAPMLIAIDKGRVPKGFRGGQLRHAAAKSQYVCRHETLGARRTAALEQAMK